MAKITRRDFLKFKAAGIAVSVVPYGSRAFAALFEDKPLSPIEWRQDNGEARFRIDGIAKVTGSKVFARDIRAKDMPQWPDNQSHAMVLRVTRADRIFEGINLSRLANGLMPDRLVTAEDLTRDGLMQLPRFFDDTLMARAGETAAHLGAAVAVLIFHDFARFRLAKQALQFRQDVIQYGAETGPIERPPWGSYRYVRVGGDSPYDEDVFSSLKDSPIFPGYKKQELEWPEADLRGDVGERGMYYAEEIGREIERPGRDVMVLSRDYFSQSTDMAALEPDSVNTWYNEQEHSLHMVIPTQSPQDAARHVAEICARGKAPVKQLYIHPCHTVGYGTKDRQTLPYLGLAAAFYAGGRPLRISHDRFEHFQTSHKRHSFKMHYNIAVNKNNHRFEALQADMQVNGGGRRTYSPSVARAGIVQAQSIYYFPKSDLQATSIASRAVDAGSARGYGALQTLSATEMLVDEVAQELGTDAIDLRLKNVLKSGMKASHGAVPTWALRAEEILQKARKHPLWENRSERKSRYEQKHPGYRYGVGFACIHKDFGMGVDAAFAGVELSADGRIHLRHTGAEIGTGTATSQAIVCSEWLGRAADKVTMAVIDWADLPMVSGGNPFVPRQDEQDRNAENPFWTPHLASPSSATNSAYFFSHATREAARIIFDFGLWPAALAIWMRGIGGGQVTGSTLKREHAQWIDGHLTVGGMQPLSLPTLAAKAHKLGLVTGAVTHVFDRWQWAEAEFSIDGQTDRRPIDGLSVRYGEGAPERKKSQQTTPGGFHPLPRLKAYFPPAARAKAYKTYYSGLGMLVELAVNTGTGKVSVLSHHSIMECGKMLVPELVSGQLQGGIAMGIGHALHEYLPLYEDGPGNGTWNFNRYHVPRARDVAVWHQSADVLPPLSDSDPNKGVAEGVTIPVIPAIANALAHATGHRFRELPVTPEKIREVLL
ncbi:xanthine dehydrogenase family protein molybdopterin-binding subunit [Pseudomaricurvus alkylphenolicus]|uniref:xanthine dehydrogenase family protein molybdopterin-binding subunit n=1 Tax=Pseudomaricurvus alkylphenolicus TaxID=1306991 RepID=UPI0014214964|nr:molybdopterin cofactor-binding domain-containing protein [Pseudomaricurvus alkylphenolicus]NIB40825.1 xanthine dehydrogenase family protein molybdopterin-binding subunit [Pseudomaricurvus alkylphenolicus]